MALQIRFPATCALALAATLAFSAPHASAQTVKPATGSLTIAFAAEATTLDPVKYSAGVDTYFIGQMFEQLVKPNPTQQRVNWLAESWEVTEVGGKPVLDVKIRKGVKFHNGDPLTARDFEFSQKRLADPAQSRWSHLQAAVERFEVVNDHQFKIHFKEGDGSYIADNLQLWAMPKAYFEKVGDEGFAKAPVGTGPWKFVSRSVKEELKLEAFDDYWHKTARPTVKNLTIKVIPEDLTRVAAFKTGAVDWIDAVPPSMIAEFKKMPGVQTSTVVSGNNLFIDFAEHVPNSPWRDVRVRQAAAHAIDVDAIVKAVLFGQGERYVQVGKGGAGYDPSLKPYPYDPRKAKELLTQAGFPRGFDTNCYNLTTPREPNVKEMGEAVFAYLTASGIRCKVQGLEYGAWINLGRRGRNGPPEMDGVISWMWGQGIPGDPGTAWAGHLHSFVAGKGWGSYSYANDPELDAMVEEAKRTMDPAKREAVLQRIGKLKHERVLGGLPTYRPLVTIAWRDKVDYTPWPWPGFWRNLQQIGLKQP
jgi:peptide/nickel transport system substrate-binding protein